MPQNLSHSSGTHAKGGNSEAANTAILEELEKGFKISDQDNKVLCVHPAAMRCARQVDRRRLTISDGLPGSSANL
jgi:hypothetical protein